MKDLSPKQRAAAILLGNGKMRKEAAYEVGVHEETITKWNRNPKFRKAVREEVDAFIAYVRVKCKSELSEEIDLNKDGFIKLVNKIWDGELRK